MPRKPASVPLSVEERRAAKIRAWEEKRRRRGKHSADDPLVYDVSACPPCGPVYDVTDVPRAVGPADDVPVRRVRT